MQAFRTQTLLCRNLCLIQNASCSLPACPVRRSYSSINLAQFASATETKTLPTPRPDYAKFLNDPEAVLQSIKARGSLSAGKNAADLIESIAKGRAKVIRLQDEIRELQTERNRITKLLADKSTSVADRTAAKEKAVNIRNDLRAAEKAHDNEQERLLPVAFQIPNDIAPDTPVGPYDSHIEVQTTHHITEKGGSPQADDKADHVALLGLLGWLYMPTHVTGSSWPYLLGGGALLEMALVRYALHMAIQAGYTVVFPPDVVKNDIVRSCGYAPRDTGEESQTYFVSRLNEGNGQAAELALAATAEIPLAGMFTDKLYRNPETELPIKVVAFGHAFRAEAGSRGKDARGLYRVHQFTKVELFQVTKGDVDVSGKALQEMKSLQWTILEQLGLPLRLLDMPTQELGAAAYKKYDIEAWMPGRGSWGELASASNCTDFQARRLGIRHSPLSSDAQARNQFAHTLNATAAAIPRLIVALVENGARFNEQGDFTSLELPECLRPHWIGGEASQDQTKISLVGGLKKDQDIVLQWKAP